MRCVRTYVSVVIVMITFGLAAVTAVPVAAQTATSPQASAVFDAAKRKRTRHQIGDYFSVSFYSTLSHLAERERRRDDDVRDGLDQTQLLLGFVGKVHLRPWLMAFVHAETSLQDRKTHISRGRLTNPQLKEALIAVRLSPATTLSFGRLRLSDAHRWVADASVDGVHIGHRVGARVLEFAAFSGTRKITADFLLVHFGHAGPATRWGVLGLAERDRGAQRLHVHGYFARVASERLHYQANIGVLAGDAMHGASAGLGFDVRAIRRLGGGKRKPQLSFGLAYGSRGFAQPGLHTNKTYDGGQFQFHRYGYVYQAELTNMAALQMGLGLRPSRRFSADLLISAYAQPATSSIGPDARFDGLTTGRSHFLGHEIAVVGAWRPSKAVKVEAGAGRFKPGRAYVDRSTASRAFARISVQF
ncbi:MAG: alginate export family protein [Pseudomonadota bacterium]